MRRFYKLLENNTEVPNKHGTQTNTQNLRKIGQGVRELWSDIQISKQTNRQTEISNLLISTTFHHLKRNKIFKQYENDFLKEIFSNGEDRRR